MKDNENYPCKIDYIPQANVVNAGMIFQKNWPFTKLFNYHLLRMKEEGILDRLLVEYMNRIKRSCDGDQRIRSVIKHPKPIESDKILFLYVILASGFLFAIFSLFVEMVYQRFNAN